jgi:hypothetical protein
MAHTLLVGVGVKGRYGWSAAVSVLLLLIFANSNSVLGQPDSIYRLPAGTRIRLKLDAELNSRAASVNDTFLAFVAQPVIIRDAVVLPVGCVIEGRVAGVDRAGSARRGGMLDLAFGTLTVSGRSRRIDAFVVQPLRRDRNSRFGLLSVIGSAAVGAVVGGVARSATGAAAGGAAGAGIGTAMAVLKKGRDARLRRGEEFEIELRSAVVLPVEDF